MADVVRRLGAVAAVAAVVLFAAPVPAQTGLSPEVMASIRGAVAASRALEARETALAQGLGNPYLAATTARKARRRADAALTSAVINIIAADRASANAVVQAAVAEAPESRDTIIASVAAAFPALGAPPGGVAVAAVPPAAVFVPRAPAPVGRAAPPLAFEEEVEGLPEDIFDPLEWVNRKIFWFNDTLDILVLRPVAVIYGFILPEIAKRSVRNFFNNLNSPVLLANDLLQLTFRDATVTTGRFLINTTLGVFGFFEVADRFGLEPHHSDFGQTMHSYGLGQGLYIMLPVLGPSTARDSIGGFVDSFFQPANYLLSPGASLALSASEGVSKRESLIAALDDLRANSLDYYAAVRGAFYQDRATELRKGRADTAGTIDALFEEIE